MVHEIYLMWVPNQTGGDWGVFRYGCPDPHDFPEYIYQKYKVGDEQQGVVFRNLLKVQERFRLNGVLPDKEKGRDIFPKLSELLKGDYPKTLNTKNK